MLASQENGDYDFEFLAASLLASSGSAAKTIFSRALTIPPATQAGLYTSKSLVGSLCLVPWGDTFHFRRSTSLSVVSKMHG